MFAHCYYYVAFTVGYDVLGIFNYCLFSVVRLSMTVFCKEYRYVPTRAELGNSIRAQYVRDWARQGIAGLIGLAICVTIFFI